MARVLTEAWSDDAFKQRLLNAPAEVLREKGLEVPQDRELCAVEDTGKLMHLIIPPRPAGIELTDEQLDSVAGGLKWWEDALIIGGAMALGAVTGGAAVVGMSALCGGAVLTSGIGVFIGAGACAGAGVGGVIADHALGLG